MPEIQSDLKQRLSAWAQAYGGEQLRRLGYSSLDRIGDAPANDSNYHESEQVERIVQALEQSGRWKEARVLRAEYFMPGLAEPERISRLKRLGLSISRTSYYVYLDAGHAFVAGALSAATQGEPS